MKKKFPYAYVSLEEELARLSKESAESDVRDYSGDDYSQFDVTRAAVQTRLELASIRSYLQSMTYQLNHLKNLGIFIVLIAICCFALVIGMVIHFLLR